MAYMAVDKFNQPYAVCYVLAFCLLAHLILARVYAMEVKQADKLGLAIRGFTVIGTHELPELPPMDQDSAYKLALEHVRNEAQLYLEGLKQ